jgi:heterogeneous nuclear rnp K-like protein 2
MSAETETSNVDVSELSAGVSNLNIDGANGDDRKRTDADYAQETLTLRAIVSSKEAGVIIGKEGKNVAELRETTQVRAGVSKVVQGVHDRVLTITGPLENITKAYYKVSQNLLDGAPQMGMGGLINTNGTHRKYGLYTADYRI